MRKVTRREFFGRCAGIAVGSLAVPQLIRTAWTEAAPSISTVPDIFVVKNGSPAEMVRKVIDRFGGIGALVKKGSKVVLKPNMTWELAPAQSGNTHPEICKVLAEMVMKAEPREVIALDNPLRKNAFEVSGCKAALEEVPGVKVLKTDEEKYYKMVEIPKAKKIGHPIFVAKDILDADAIINIPNAKTHGSTIVTFGMKNWMGIVHDRGYFHSQGLWECIAEISSAVKPTLVIVDATRITLYGGPNNSNPAATRSLNMLIAGKDQVAVDAYCVGIADWQNRKWKPQDIPHIRYAAELGVGRMDVEKLNVELVDMKA